MRPRTLVTERVHGRPGCTIRATRARRALAASPARRPNARAPGDELSPPSSASSPPPLRLGTRGSELALRQARRVVDRLRELPGAPPVEIVTVHTGGDLLSDVPLSSVAGRAFFTREIEEALAGGEIDLAVHSLKDLATELPPGLVLAAVLPRADPRDVLVTRDAGAAELDRLPAGARVGTSSLRRKALLARWRPDLRPVDLRGNVPTRLRRLDAGELDAVVLAAAGLERLELDERIGQRLPVERFPPAVGQGALAVEARAADSATARWLAALDDPATRVAITAERALLARLEGGCQVPVGALGELAGPRLVLAATVCSLDGRAAVEGRREGDPARPEELGDALAGELLARGGDAILAAIRRPAGPSA